MVQSLIIKDDSYFWVSTFFSIKYKKTIHQNDEERLGWASFRTQLQFFLFFVCFFLHHAQSFVMIQIRIAGPLW